MKQACQKRGRVVRQQLPTMIATAKCSIRARGVARVVYRPLIHRFQFKEPVGKSCSIFVYLQKVRENGAFFVYGVF